MNTDLEKLQPYPFERLNKLKSGIEPPGDKPHIPLSIGEPKHATPAFLTEAVLSHLHNLAAYPTTRGLGTLRESLADWVTWRFKLPKESISADRHVLPVNGTREALFAFAQAVIDRTRPAKVMMPNPFYQIYEGAALLAGAEPQYLSCTSETGFLPDFDAVDEDSWEKCQLLYICTPGNPTGAVMETALLQKLIGLAHKHDFVIASDECYSEIFHDENKPPPGLLQAAAEMGVTDYRKCLVFHSLSKRSNAPGLRSGFVAGDADILSKFLSYRTYHGCAMPLQHQAASTRAWQDEEHVRHNRDLYREKFDAVLSILGDSLSVERPAAGFYLWPETPVPDTDFARGLFERQHVTVLPGSYLSREVNRQNPGHHRVRLALVASVEECIEAAKRIKNFVESH